MAGRGLGALLACAALLLGGGPWLWCGPSAARGARTARRASLAEKYLAQAVHPQLFDIKKVDEWVLPEVRKALAEWQETGDATTIDVAALPKVRVDAPGIISFSFLEESFVDEVLQEVKHFTEESGLPQAPPNSMNRYGAILNDIGLRPSFTTLLNRYLKGIAARLFGSDGDRAESLGGAPLGTEDWGGSSLSDHHTFVVRYSPDGDRGLDMHVDDCDVTFNFGLVGPADFQGGDLYFCGLYGEESYRRKHTSYVHELGRCVVHSGKRRHAVGEVEEGQRASLIMWTKSFSWRKTAAYEERVGDFVSGRKELPVEEQRPPDRICMSLTHDRDYFDWMR